MLHRIAITLSLGLLLAAQSRVADAQPFESGAKVRVNTSVYNPETRSFDSAQQDGTVVDSQEFSSHMYDVAAEKVVEESERIYIIDYEGTRRLAREEFINSDVKPASPRDALFAEIARQRGAEKPLKRSAALDAEAAEQAHAIANLEDPTEGTNLSVQTVGKSLQIEPARLGVIVSVGLPSAETVVYGLGGREATGLKDDRQAWDTLLNPGAEEIGIGVAAINRRAQNLEGPATGLVWVVILSSPKPTTDPMPASPPPVGEWAIHQYEGPDDKEGKVIGTIKVEASGKFERQIGEERQTGSLWVEDQVLNLKLAEGVVERRPIATLANDDGTLVGYELSDDESPIEWLPVRKPVRGPIPVGVWAIHQYEGQADRRGRIIGRIRVDKSGAFEQKVGDETSTGTLWVENQVLTLKFADGQTEERPIVPLADDDDNIVGYELSDEESPIEWLPPKSPTPSEKPGRVPVGNWAIHVYEGPDDRTGRVIGQMRVAASGRFQRTLDDEVSTGTLSVAEEMLTLVFESGESTQRSIRPIVGRDGRELGYDLSDSEQIVRWLPSRKAPPEEPVEPVAKKLPGRWVGAWNVRRFDDSSDEKGSIVGVVRITADGAIDLRLGDEPPVAGRIVVADEQVELSLGDQDPVVLPYRITSRSIKLGQRDENDTYEEWERPNPKAEDPPVPNEPTPEPGMPKEPKPEGEPDSPQPAPQEGKKANRKIPPTLVRTWQIRRFESAEDEEGAIVGTATVAASGEVTVAIEGEETVTGRLTILESDFRLEFPEQEALTLPAAVSPNRVKLGRREENDTYEEWELAELR